MKASLLCLLGEEGEGEEEMEGDRERGDKGKERGKEIWGKNTLDF
jgi:hypothetical protein